MHLCPILLTLLLEFTCDVSVENLDGEIFKHCLHCTIVDHLTSQPLWISAGRQWDGKGFVAILLLLC